MQESLEKRLRRDGKAHGPSGAVWWRKSLRAISVSEVKVAEKFEAGRGAGGTPTWERRRVDAPRQGACVSLQEKHHGGITLAGEKRRNRDAFDKAARRGTDRSQGKPLYIVTQEPETDDGA